MKKNKEGLKHLGLYALSYLFVEIVLVGFFGIATINQGPTVWVFFGWLQFAAPLVAGLVWLMFEGMLYNEKVNEAEAEWNKRVAEVVKYIEEKRKNEEEKSTKDI